MIRTPARPIPYYITYTLLYIGTVPTYSPDSSLPASGVGVGVNRNPEMTRNQMYDKTKRNICDKVLHKSRSTKLHNTDNQRIKKTACNICADFRHKGYCTVCPIQAHRHVKDRDMPEAHYSALTVHNTKVPATGQLQGLYIFLKKGYI